MKTVFNRQVPQGTARLSSALLWDLGPAGPEIIYHPVPHRVSTSDHPVWRVRFNLTFDPQLCFGLDINGEVILGRGESAPDLFSLIPYEANELGVSRRHVLLRPSDARLYVMDLGSTNGTWCNDRSIGMNTPYSLSDGDILRLGRLELMVHILKRPHSHTAMLHARADLADLLVPIAQAITSQLDLREVMQQTIELAQNLSLADEIAFWLVDEQTGQIVLEAERLEGIEQTDFPGVPSEYEPVAAVRQSGQILYLERPRDPRVEAHTGRTAEAALYIPLSLGGITFGVLQATQYSEGQPISTGVQKSLEAIANLAAVAVQNARTYQSAEFAAARRAQVLNALNGALFSELRMKLNEIIGYADVLVEYGSLDEESLDFTSRILVSADEAAEQLRHLVELTASADAPLLYHASCDLTEIMNRIVVEFGEVLDPRSITLEFASHGTPYTIQGDSGRLYRSISTLITNLLDFTPDGGHLSLNMEFTMCEIVIRIRDASQTLEKPQSDIPRQATSTAELGLALVWATIEAHRGSIMAENVDGLQVEFIVRLPATLRAG